MSLSTNVSNLATRIATEIKSLRTLINGNVAGLTGLDTSDQTSLVAAINEIKASADIGARIDDTGASEDRVYSSTKTEAVVSAAVAAVVDAAPAALDTLNELAAALGDDANYASTITTALSGKAADSAVVKLTGAQTVAGVKTFSSSPVVPDASFAIAAVTGLQAALDAKATTANVGDTTVNYVTTFEAGLV